MTNNVDFFVESSDFDKSFEIDLVIKDAAGNPTKRRRSYVSDSAYKVWQFWMRNQGKPKRKRGKPNLPISAGEADQIVKNLYKEEINPNDKI